MSLLKATGIISDHIGTAPVAGIGMNGLSLGSLGSLGSINMPMGMGSMNIPMGMGSMGSMGSMNMPIGMSMGMDLPMGSGVSMGMGPMGFGAIRQTGSLGGLSPVKFSSKTNSILHPAGMPIATTLNPFNPYDMNSTIVTRPFSGLSGLSGLDLNSFGGLAGLMGTTVEKVYNSNGVNVVIRGCNSDINAIVKCLDDHLSSVTITKPTTTTITPTTTTTTPKTTTTTITPTIASTGMAPIRIAPSGTGAVFPPAPASSTSSLFESASSTPFASTTSAAPVAPVAPVAAPPRV